jgi:hypothetical protein
MFLAYPLSKRLDRELSLPPKTYLDTTKAKLQKVCSILLPTPEPLNGKAQAILHA